VDVSLFTINENEIKAMPPLGPVSHLEGNGGKNFVNSIDISAC